MSRIKCVVRYVGYSADARRGRPPPMRPVTPAFQKPARRFLLLVSSAVSDQAASPRQCRARREPIVSKANDARFFITTHRKR